LKQDSDREILKELRLGTERALDLIMLHYKQPIINFVYRMTGDPGEAEDIAQEVFIKAYRSMCDSKFREDTASVSAWLFRVARNAAIDRLRKVKRRPTSSLEEAGEANKVQGAGGTAADEAIARETDREVAAAVAGLPEDQRTAVILAEYEGLSCAEIAVIMKCSVKSVESRLYRARRHLRKKLSHLLT
jgi:RNA polymerase sigma-70 factor (ECF subfamily)